jgi:hypothetical protein
MANSKVSETIYQKLNKIKKRVGKISKDSTNPFYKSKYFDINQLLENIEVELEKEKILILQPIQDDKVTTQLINLEEPFEVVTSSISLPALNDPQKIGSAVTYYRRYTLQSLLALQAEDDDGNKASGKTNNVSKGDTVQKQSYVSKKIPDAEKKWLNDADRETGEPTRDWSNIEAKIETKVITDINQIRDAYKVSNAIAEKLEKLFKLNN